MPAHADEQGTRMLGDANPGVRFPAEPHDHGDVGDRLHVVDRGGAAPDPRLCGEGRFHAGVSPLSLEGIHQGRFFTADVCPRTPVQVEIGAEPAPEDVLAQVSFCIGIVNRRLEHPDPPVVFAADVEVCGLDAHGVAGDDTSLDQQVRVDLEDPPVLEGARLALVAVHAQVLRQVGLLRHEGPLQTGGEARATAAAEVRFLHLVGHLLRPKPERLAEHPVSSGRLVDIDPVQTGGFRKNQRFHVISVRSESCRRRRGRDSRGIRRRSASPGHRRMHQDIRPRQA